MGLIGLLALILKHLSNHDAFANRLFGPAWFGHHVAGSTAWILAGGTYMEQFI